jgi:hypothetical protein
MRNTRHLFLLSSFLLAMSGPPLASAHCDTSPDLSAVVAEFDSTQISRIDALLRFGKIRNVCFGIEYIDTKLLTEPVDFHIRNMSVRDAIKRILGQERMLSVRLNNGVVEISAEELRGEGKSIFDFVLPKFEARRAPLQEISTALRMQLIVNLNPRVTGFAGNYSAGDLRDEVGPISEYNRSIRYLLDQLAAQSKGAAWIATVRWKSSGDLALAEQRPVWTVIEYGAPNTGYASLLNSIASELGPEPPISARGKQ